MLRDLLCSFKQFQSLESMFIMDAIASQMLNINLMPVMVNQLMQLIQHVNGFINAMLV